MQPNAMNLSQGRPSLASEAQASINNGTGNSGELEQMLRQTTRDNQQLKHQLQQMIDLNSQQQMQLAVQQSKTGATVAAQGIASKPGAPFTPHQAYTSQPPAAQENPVASIIDKKPLSRDKLSQRRPIGSRGSASMGKGLVQETHGVPMNLNDRNMVNVVEKEDDRGTQQVSGGFGDSNTMDAAALQIAFTGEQRALALALKFAPVDPEQWAQNAENLEYTMESQVFDYELLRQAPEFGMKQYNEAVYRGELANGKRQGLGVMQYRKARVYEGQWQADARSGRGMERYSNGNRYEGEFLNGKPHGKGVYTWANGEVYEGEWAAGLKEGQGIWKGIFGDSYIGEWRQSKATGYGVHQWKNGDRYEGEWSNCLKHGQGSDIFANGDCFTGTYTQGKPEGQGQYKWKNGSIYIGEFLNGLKHGKGKWKKRFNDQNCNMYEGAYEHDKKNGMGMFTWESGNFYKGCYKDDERHGYGEMFWKDGSCYKGEWVHGIQNGVGRMEFPDGRVKEGLFENNTFKGPQMATPQLRNMKAQEILLNQTITTPPNGMEAVDRGSNRIRITKSRAGSHPRQILADSGRIQLPKNIEKQPNSPEPPSSESAKKVMALQHPPPRPSQPDGEAKQGGQGSQVQQNFENVDVNPFIVVKPHHKTAAKVQLKRPGVLNPVQDPKHRDHSIGGSSDGGDRSLQGSVTGMQNSHGYLSGGLQTDNESARLSNVQPYKFNTQARKDSSTNRKTLNALNIRKINPNSIQLKAPVSRGSGVGQGLKQRSPEYGHTPQVSQTIAVAGGERSVLGPDHMAGGQSRMSGGSIGLPDLKKINHSVNNRTSAGAATLSSAGSGAMADVNQKLRRASPEALALMMANKKSNDAASQKSSHWVPGGKSLARENSRQRKLFY